MLVSNKRWDDAFALHSGGMQESNFSVQLIEREIAADARFLGDVSGRNARLRLPEGFWHAATMEIATWPCGSFSRTMIFNFGAAITSRAAHG
jgi:hypothetical protein